MLTTDRAAAHRLSALHRSRRPPTSWTHTKAAHKRRMHDLHQRAGPIQKQRISAGCMTYIGSKRESVQRTDRAVRRRARRRARRRPPAASAPTPARKAGAPRRSSRRRGWHRRRRTATRMRLARSPPGTPGTPPSAPPGRPGAAARAAARRRSWRRRQQHHQLRLQQGHRGQRGGSIRTADIAPDSLLLS